MRFGTFEFGSLQIDGVTYQHDIVIDRGKVLKRKKKRSKPFRGPYGHTPLTAAEGMPWNCRRLVVGTGASGALPILRGCAGSRGPPRCARHRPNGEGNP
jgi:hypothetical protein